MATKRKTTTAIVAAVTALALLLGGTFAWTSISQQAKNEAIVDINPGGRLHDDFNGINKDVYVENFGDTTTGVPIFARIRLDQYFEVGQDAGINKGEANRKVDPILGTDINDVTTWITYLPGDDLGDTSQVQANANWQWNLGNEDGNLPYYMPTFNKNKDSLKADINGTYEGTTEGDIVHYDDYQPWADGDSLTQDATYDWDDDTEEDYVTETRNENDPIDAADVLRKEETHTAAQVTYAADVISMADWLALSDEDKIGNFWVYDTDGWAYWAQPIAPGETTGLLLDSINMSKVPDDNYYYGINVVGQFATASDWEKFKEDDPMTEDAEKLMEIITAVPPTTDDLKGSRPVALLVEDTLYFVRVDNAQYPTEITECTYEGVEATAIYDSIKGTGDSNIPEYDFENFAFGVKKASNGTDLVAPPWSELSAQVTEVVFVDTIKPVSTALWFSEFNILTTVDASNLDVSASENLFYMFNTCNKLTEITGISEWDTSSVQNMREVFNVCSALETLDLSKWDTSSVTDMSGMFTHCNNIKTVEGIDGWDTSNVTDMSYMFGQCHKLETLDVSGWDTGRIEDMNNMFNYCEALKNLDLSRWNTANVKDMHMMFEGCEALETVGDISKWKTSNVTNMKGMFNYCKNFESLDLSGWNVTNVTKPSEFNTQANNITPPKWVN